VSIDVLYVDNHLLVVNKPAGVLSQEDITGDHDLLSLAKDWVKREFDKPGNVYLGLVHRLDRPTSGVMVFARTSKAAARLSDQFRKRTTEKRYVAIVEGHADLDGTLVDHLVKRDRHVETANEGDAGARRAELNVQVIRQGSRNGRPVSLVDVDLGTGRAHQIRVQLSSRGHPIVGDMRYGASVEFDGRNLALHAYQLSVQHPTLREAMTFSAMPSSDWKVFEQELASLVPDQDAGKE
jgi:23S rRNA pseudouridine1911/1915/1917 synthase